MKKLLPILALALLTGCSSSAWTLPQTFDGEMTWTLTAPAKPSALITEGQALITLHFEDPQLEGIVDQYAVEGELQYLPDTITCISAVPNSTCSFDSFTPSTLSGVAWVEADELRIKLSWVDYSSEHAITSYGGAQDIFNMNASLAPSGFLTAGDDYWAIKLDKAPYQKGFNSNVNFVGSGDGVFVLDI